MKTFTKLLTIAGTVAFSGVCLISKADPKIMTLEELKVFLKNAKDGCVTYLEQDNAIVVETSDPAFKTKLERLDEADAKRKKYSYPKFYGLDEFSRRVPTQVLKEYGIKTQRTEGYFDKEEVYEITFNSILSSTYFSEKERKKAKEQFLDYNAFTDAIDTYTKDVAILRNISVKVLTDDKTKKSEANDCSHEYTKTITYKLSDGTLTQAQGWLNKHLKALGKLSRGRAAIILLLLFDQKIPSEYRVQWISNTTANVYNFEYLELILKNFETNRINLEFGILDIMSYICYRFFPKGKTFDDYQWEFEEKFFEKTEEDNEEDKEEVHNDKSNIESDFRFCFILRKPQKLMTLEEAVVSLENKKSETHDGVITKIEYSTNEYGFEVPTIIEGTNKEKINYACGGSFKLNPKREKTKPEQISKVLKKEDLLKRGLTDDEFKLLGNSSVHEITFNSILESGCFSEEQKSKAKAWLKDPHQLRMAISYYFENCTFLELIDVTIKNSKNGEIWDSGTRAFKASDALSEDLRELFKNFFSHDDFLKSKTAAEKIILLLLFDEITPPEYRLSWACSPTLKDTYEPSWNIINLPKVNSDETAFQEQIISALHEIGHYLDYQIGLFQDFKSWENPFAKKLLLLESKYEKNKQTISLPQSLFEDFVDYQWAANNPCTESDLFIRWQTFSRWGHVDELQNMLGICFAQDGKTIYLNALSEVRALEKHIHYGHNAPKEHETYKDQFKTQDEQAIFEKIVQEARNRKPDPKVLNLLCKLHKLAPGIEVFNLFDDNQEHSHTLQMLYD